MTAPEKSAQPAAGEPFVYLVGHTPFQEYLDFMAAEPINAASADRKQLANFWRAADDRIRQLQTAEANWANDAPVLPLPPELTPLRERVHADPIFDRAFSYVPFDIGLVELDRLVVRQRLVSLEHVQRIKERLGRSPDLPTVFRTCLPFEHHPVRHRVRWVSDDTFVFMSESNDLRFLEPVVFEPGQIGNYRPLGPLAGVLGLVVGYGSNYLNAIAAEGRLVLNNGSHRAYALRDLGITHVPCVIQKVSRREELGVVGAGALVRHPDRFLRTPRPPVLKDYFDPQLRTIVPLAPTVRHVRVRFSIEQLDVPENR